jgi:hypothetical protein
MPIFTQPRGTWIDESLIDHNLLNNLQGGQAGQYYHFTAAEYVDFGNIPTTYLKLDASNDPVTGQLDMSNHIIPTTKALYDLGSSSLFWRTLYLSNNGGNVALCEGVQSGGGPTNYTFNCGGGQFGGDQNQGGTFTFKMNDISSSLGTCRNFLVLDPGRPDVFAAGTTNDVIFQAYNGIATYGFVSSFGGWNDIEYGLELRRISGTETFAKTLIFDNQIPVSDFRRSIDFRIGSVNKLTIENDGTVLAVDRLQTPFLNATVITNGFSIGIEGAGTSSWTGYPNFFGLNWFDYITVFSTTTNLPMCLGIFPNGTGNAGYVNVYNNGNIGATAWLEMGVRGAIAELVVRDFSQTTNITTLNIGSGGNDFPTFDVTCTTLTDINLIFAGVTYYNFTSTLLTFSDAVNMAFNTATGTKIGTATNQKLAFYNSIPIVQPSSTGQTAGHTGGVGANIQVDSTFTGGVGAIAYTIGDIVRHLKNLGLIAA